MEKTKLNTSFFKDNLLKLLPDLTPLSKKYSNGRCAMIGSNSYYTGGIYSSAISAMKSGADISHIFAHEDSVSALKAYSHDIIVHKSYSNNPNIDLLNENKRWLKSFDSIVIGPCLGKDDYVKIILEVFIKESSKFKNIVHIFDADSIYFFHTSQLFSVFKEYLENNICILTPNRVEFDKLIENHFIEDNLNFKEEKTYENFYIEYYTKNYLDNPIQSFEYDQLDSDLKEIFRREVLLSQKLGQIIFKKGTLDIITDGSTIYLICNEGSMKRCAGIGDILAGVLASFIPLMNGKSKKEVLLISSLASFWLRYISKEVYEEKGISLISSDIINQLSLFSLDKIKSGKIKF